MFHFWGWLTINQVTRLQNMFSYVIRHATATWATYLIPSPIIYLCQLQAKCAVSRNFEEPAFAEQWRWKQKLVQLPQGCWCCCDDEGASHPYLPWCRAVGGAAADNITNTREWSDVPLEDDGLSLGDHRNADISLHFGENQFTRKFFGHV